MVVVAVVAVAAIAVVVVVAGVMIAIVTIVVLVLVVTVVVSGPWAFLADSANALELVLISLLISFAIRLLHRQNCHHSTSCRRKDLPMTDDKHFLPKSYDRTDEYKHSVAKGVLF